MMHVLTPEACLIGRSAGVPCHGNIPHDRDHGNLMIMGTFPPEGLDYQ